MSYDHGLVERVRDALTRAGVRGFRERSLFGGWGFLEGKSVFAVAWDRGFVVKMAPDEYQAALHLFGVTPFSPMGENSMSTWVVANDEATADDDDLVEWVQRGLRGVRATPLKRPSAKRKPATVRRKKR
jgi:TfoX/Sxy family transcriptional regulator of competence genes